MKRDKAKRLFERAHEGWVAVDSLGSKKTMGELFDETWDLLEFGEALISSEVVRERVWGLMTLVATGEGGTGDPNVARENLDQIMSLGEQLEFDNHPPAE